MIPLAVPLIAGNEWKYVKECLDTNWVSSAGKHINCFEENVARYLAVKYSVAVTSGTAALHLSLLANGVGSGHEVLVPTLTFIAPVNTIKYCGAEPVFVDCEPDTLCLDTAKLKKFLKSNAVRKKDGVAYNKKTGRCIKAIIPVHVFGHPVDMDELVTICKNYNIKIIEDATESLGSEYKNKKTGVLGDIGCFSFNGNKIVTTGGGGMIVTNNKKLASTIRHMSTQAKKGNLEYDHDEIGYNCRLSNINAAMGLAQMERIDEFINIKRKNAAIYRQALSKIKNLSFLWEQGWVKSNFWFYTIKVPKRHKNKLIKYLMSKQIHVRPIWKLMHTLLMYKNCQQYEIKHAIEAYETCINLPCSLNLELKDIEYVVKNISDYFKKS